MMTNQTNHIIQVAVPAPLRKCYHYTSIQPLIAGSRVVVSFGNRKVIGIVLGSATESIDKPLKPIIEVLDRDGPALDKHVLSLALWASNYYHHPIGEVLQNSLPPLLRKTNDIVDPSQHIQIALAETHYSESIDELLQRAPKQRALFEYLQQNAPISVDEIDYVAATLNIRNIKPLLAILLEKQLIEKKITAAVVTTHNAANETPPNPTAEQQACIESILRQRHQYQPFVLQGITGSGKTEVYMALTAANIAEQRQTLILVPEISLTPQLVKRFSQRFGNQVCSYHSSMSNKQRYQTWFQCRTGRAQVVLGTRSAIFLGFKNLGSIIVDEEHDQSFKQHDGFRYHARDLALKRASMANIPVVLGSATPSIESIHNTTLGKFSLLRLNQRIGSGGLPVIKLVDMHSQIQQDGISTTLQKAIKQALANQQQVILYVNRRGYAPVALCYSCGWKAQCERCDAHMTFHKETAQLRCHHCGKVDKRKLCCPECDEKLYFGGAGTQRVQTAIAKLFPENRVIRFDRDEITTQNKLEQALKDINNHQYDIIIGTQLIVKGHDFSNVSLVGIIDADQGLFSCDFRAPEYLLQQLLQVGGRAGRSNQLGTVIVQSHYVDNPFYQYVLNHDFDHFQQQCQNERQQVSLPPFGYLALWRAESTKPMVAIQFLNSVKQVGLRLLKTQADNNIQIMDSVPSPMEKRAGRFRAQLLIKSTQRKPLHQLLNHWIDLVEQNKKIRHVRWSIDIDPKDMN